MNRVRLYGHLRRRFGREFRLDVRSPIEAVNALTKVLPGFQNHVCANSEPGYRIWVDESCLTPEEYLIGGYYSSKVIKIIPVIVGSSGDFGKIIIGAALIAFALWTGGAGYGVAAAYGEGGLVMAAGAVAFSVGVSLVLSGVVGALFKPPKKEQSAESPQNTPGYAFNGPVNTIGQGNPVPICYGGPIRVGSQVVSMGISTEEMPVTSGGTALPPPVAFGKSTTEDHLITGNDVDGYFVTVDRDFHYVESVNWVIDASVTVGFNPTTEGPLPGEYQMTTPGTFKFNRDDTGKVVSVKYRYSE